ncbi:hypothetical protein [Sinomonas notoginsengisoli]|uniref:hypothetical protein n=1 Tax=Sinomonas notoginsengisoli TaxID=1457311 RepID=UPI001F480ED5|nr:hypothetical protein [Sinomonas notoginsengisoli]
MAQHAAAADNDDPQEHGLEELGALVLRVWREPDGEQGLKVRILASDGPREPATMAVVADPDAAIAAVRSWLDDRQQVKSS